MARVEVSMLSAFTRGFDEVEEAVIFVGDFELGL